MQTVFLTGIKKMELADSFEPQLNSADQVKIKMKAIGVCGSDVHYYSVGKIGTQVVSYPFPVGHECSGIVVEAGENVKRVRVGDLVVIDPSVHCGKCDQCLSGRPHTCRNNRFLGCPGQLDGCLSNFIVMPEFCCYPVTGLLSPVKAALIEPFSIGIYAVRLAEIKKAAPAVVIFGVGPIGLSVLFKLLADGIDNIGIIEPLQFRLDKALETGAKYGINPEKDDVEKCLVQYEPMLVDYVFEASGEQKAVDNAVRCLKPGGKLILIGIPPSGQYIFDMDLMRRKEIAVVNVRRQNHCVEEAIELAISGKADIEKMVTHHFSLEETPKAFEIVDAYEDNVIKAMIDL
jgi:L-iditol 2-dehydrogenase